MQNFYDILRHPVITEKTMSLQESNQYVFQVDPSSTKTQIKKAIESIFSVNVESVQTLNRLGKLKRFRGIAGHRKGTKRAIVRLKSGQKLDILPN